jgi:hypothetical protein
MQSIVNTVRIERGARVGKIATLVGLGFLVAGLVFSLLFKDSATFLVVSFACLLMGILVSAIGTMNMNRWVKEPRADQVLAQGLRGFDNRYRLYSHYLPAPHVLLSPVGLFVITAMGQDGVIHFDGTKFRRNFSAVRLLRFMAEEGMGKPFAEADSQVESVREFLEERGAADGVEVKNMIVFYHPAAQLTISDPPRPVVNAKQMKKAIRKLRAGTELPASQYRRLRELFDQEAGE